MRLISRSLNVRVCMYIFICLSKIYFFIPWSWRDLAAFFFFFLDLFSPARASQTFTPDKLWTILCLIVAIRNHANAKFGLLVAFCLFVYRNLKAIQSPDCLPDLCMCSEWALIHFRTIINSCCAVKSNHGAIQCLLNRTRIRSVHRRDSFFWGLACLYSHWCMFVCSFFFFLYTVFNKCSKLSFGRNYSFRRILFVQRNDTFLV